MSEIKLILGDCFEKLKELSENSIDSIITDPPYDLGFMGKDWDKLGIAFNVEMWKECLRVLKPGGHLLSFGGTRTYHRMACAVEDAGFEIRDMIEWVYGSGFPKSLNVGKSVNQLETKGFSEWEGWGTALKPAHEPIVIARKPIEKEFTIAENVLKWGTGGINIDESRVETKEELKVKAHKIINSNGLKYSFGATDWEVHNLGRFPANLIIDGSDEVKECFPETKPSKSGGIGKSLLMGEGIKNNKTIQERGGYNDNGGSAARFFKSCPFTEEDFKSILYFAKASIDERNMGCENIEERYLDPSRKIGSAGGTNPRNRGAEKPRKNFHPTVKPVALMQYLIKMVTPKGGIVLDPFMGSGSTGIAAKKLGYNFIGIEKEADYYAIAEARINSVPEVLI